MHKSACKKSCKFNNYERVSRRYYDVVVFLNYIVYACLNFLWYEIVINSFNYQKKKNRVVRNTNLEEMNAFTIL